MRKKSKVFILVVACLVFILLTGCQQAEPVTQPANESSNTEQEKEALEYPTKPITIIVSYSAGGGTDTGVRILAKYAEKYVGQPLVVVNKPGGGGEVGMVELINSPNDGYTISNYNSPQTMASSIRETKYDPLKDFEFIALQVEDPRLFAVRADDDRFKTFEDFINYAKENPGKLTIGTSGAGGTSHYAVEALNYFAGIQVKPVHFGGQGEGKAAFLGGHVDAISQTLGETKQLVKDGEARIIAIAAEERLDEFPDVPTFKEKGIDFIMASSRGYAAPAGTPKEIIEYLSDAFKKTTEDPGFIEEMNNVGLPIKYKSSAEFTEFVKNEKKIFDELAAQIKE